MNIGPSDPIDHADITQGSDLSGMDLTGVDLTSADLSESYLSNVILSGADLSEVCFVNTHLTGADLTDTTLTGADLSNATLTGADLSNATLTGADLSNADLSGADLSDADLINTDLTDATLRGVDLSNATFAGADLTGADLRGTALTDNEIRGANASEARKDTTTTTTADTAGADASLSDLSQEKSADQKKSDELLTILQSLHERLDRVPKTTDLHNMSGVSQHNYTQTFGSWDKALEAAGIDKEQAILDEIKRVAKKLGHIPTTTDIHKHDAYPASKYSSCFDSWDEALRESGVKERFETESRESSDERRKEMINTVQSLYDQLDRVPKSTELPEKYSPNEFYTEFGSWDKALKAAGIDKKQAILDEIERVAKKLGHIPTTTDIHKHDAYPASRYSSCFDSWDEALRESGVKERFETESRESSEERPKEMINTLQSLHNELDKVPKSTEFPENSKYSPHDFYTEFGSWDEALKAAGIDKKQALLEDLNQVAEEVGHVPKTSDVDKHGTHSYSMYLNSSYFDSWDEALQQSGVKERFETESRESSEERRKEMINTLQSLYNQLDRVPKSTELPEKYSPNDFYTEFGGWDEALEAAGIDKEQAILDEIERVAEELGDIPTTGDIHNYAEYPASDYQSYFDSWDEALEQSGVKERFETKSKKSSDPIESDGEPSSSPDGIERLLEIRGVGRPTARRILETFGTIDEATSAPTHELTEIRGVGQGTAARIISKTGRQTGPDHDQPTTTAKSETSPENKNNDSIEILDKIANEFEEL